MINGFLKAVEKVIMRGFGFAWALNNKSVMNNKGSLGRI